MLRRLLDSPWTYFVLAGVLVVGGALSQIRIGIPARPKGDVSQLGELRSRNDLNVLFILIDTLRMDALSSYGRQRPTSPMIDTVAESGVRFAHARAQSSWTKTSMASLWLAAYPNRTGILRFDQAIAPTAAMPAEVLKRAGLLTTGLYRNAWVERNFGFARGFDVYLFPTPGPSQPQRPDGSVAGSDRDTVRTALEFLQSHERDRFFLYLHLMDVHQYYSDFPQPPFGTSRRDLYDASVRWVDGLLTELFTTLEQKNLTSRTLVVIASDHGEEFFEHGNEGHQKTLYTEVIDVPLILGLPFRLNPGVVVEEPVENVDIWPTVFDLMGLPPVADADGRSLVPVIEAAASGAKPATGRPSFSMLDLHWGERAKPPLPLVAVRQDAKALIQTVAQPGILDLFDLATDPGEQRNLATERPDDVARLRVTLDEILARPPLAAPVNVQLDAMRLDQLRALGYAVSPEAN